MRGESERGEVVVEGEEKGEEESDEIEEEEEEMIKGGKTGRGKVKESVDVWVRRSSLV